MNEQSEDSEKASKIVIAKAKEESNTLDNDAVIAPAAKSIEDQAKTSQNDDRTIKEVTEEIDAAIPANVTEEVLTKEENIKSPVNNSIESNDTTSATEVAGDVDVKKTDMEEKLMEDVTNDKVIESTVTDEKPSKPIESIEESHDESDVAGSTDVEKKSLQNHTIVDSAVGEEKSSNEKKTVETPDTEIKDLPQEKGRGVDSSELKEGENSQTNDTSVIPVNILIPKSGESAEKMSPPNDVSSLDEKKASLENERKKPSVKKPQKGLVVTVQTNVVVPPKFVHDPKKLTLKFLFANRDGLNVTCDCSPSDTVGEVKGLLLSMWPDGKSFILFLTKNLYFLILLNCLCLFVQNVVELPACTGGDQIRLICMGKGILMPDSRTLEDCNVPMFKTHPTPVNVSLKPAQTYGIGETQKKISTGNRGGGNSEHTPSESPSSSCCVIL